MRKPQSWQKLVRQNLRDQLVKIHSKELFPLSRTLISFWQD